MNISDLAEDYLVDPNKGMRKLTAGYLNEVGKVIAMEQDHDHSRQFTVK